MPETTHVTAPATKSAENRSADKNNSPSRSVNENADSTINVKNPDAVQASLVDVWHWVEHNGHLVIGVIVVLVLGASAWTTVRWLNKRAERKAQDAYYAVEAKFTKLRDDFEKGKFKKFMPAEQVKAADAEVGKIATGNLEQDYGSVMTELDSFARERVGTTAGAQAAILASATYLEYKQPEKAIELGRLTTEKLGVKSLMGQLAAVSYGNALVAKGDCASAIAAYQKVLDRPDAAYLHSDLNLRAGICFEKLQQNDRALEMYRKAAANGGQAAGQSAVAQTAKGLMRALEVKMRTTSAAAKAG